MPQERGYEETIQMADVKWEIPKHIAPEHEDVPVERTEDALAKLTAEQPQLMEIMPDIGTALVEGLQPSRVLTQMTREKEEAAGDLFATGAEMTEQREISAELSQLWAELKPETRVQPLTTRLDEEAAQV